MKRLFSLVLCCMVLPSAHAQDSNGFTNMLRSLTGAIGGEAKPPPPSTVTPTLGVRGMDDDTAVAANTATGDAKQLDSWAVGRTEAEKAAARRGLAARTVVYATPAAEEK